jgi:hypothetical protein
MCPFWLKAQGLNDMCIFKLMNLVKMTYLIIYWIENLVKTKTWPPCMTGHESVGYFSHVNMILFWGFGFFLGAHQLSSCIWQILCYHCLLVIVMTTSRRLVSLGRKLFFWCIMWNMLTTNNGWPRTLQTFNGEGE